MEGNVIIAGDSNVERCRRAIAERVKGDARVQIGVLAGQTMRAVIEGVKEKLWETKEGQNLVMIAGGLNDVLRGNGGGVGKQLRKGVMDLRATSDNVQVLVCTVPEELLRISGVSDAVYWASMFLSSMLVMSLVALLLTSMVKLPMFCALAVLPHSDFSLVLAMMLLYSVYSNLFCLLVSCVVKTPVFAVFATVCLWMLTYELPLFFMDVPGSVAYSDLTLDQKLLSSVFPNVAIHWIFRIVNLHEEYS
ncbi:hypothetical protein HPB47_023819 [Ixodes persulcatus]|uniref:Uncharacterized protein n=1 Tax=Ixodes persulcatus TaxID=34615 RepID=A0AC60Q5Z9_IXOPE|nr:hypothetical protein HPB47_023819 [Ixodes persulcatus]